jgi:TonB family protein
MRKRFVSVVLGFALLGFVSLRPFAFSQETNQEATKRKATAKVPLKYPPLARQLKLSGKVRVEVIVSPDGRVKGTRTLGGTPLLADAALEAIRMWRYEAGTKETTELVEIEFQGPKSISSIPVVFWLISEAGINNLPNPTRRVQSFGVATDLKFDSKGGRVQGLTV